VFYATASRNVLRTIGLFAGPALGVLAYVLLPDEYAKVDATGQSLVGFAHAGKATLSLMLWMATWWLTEAIDIEATALLPLVMLPLLGAESMKNAASPYADEFIFLFMGGFILALSMQRWGLDRRIALNTLRIVGSGPRAMILGFMLATALLSGFVSNTATAAMMMPVGLSVIDLVLKRKTGATLTGEGSLPDAGTPGRNFALCLMLGIAYAASIGGVGTIIGTPPNVFLIAFLRSDIAPEFRQDVSFVKWLAIGAPIVIVFIPLTWLLLTRVLYPVRIKAIEGGREFIRSELHRLGPMKPGEWVALCVFTLAAIAWMVRPILSNGWAAEVPAGEPARFIVPPVVPGLSDSGIAMIAAMLLFVIPVERGLRTFAMDWQHARRLPWGILVLFGGGLSLAGAIEANGVAEFIGGQTSRFVGVPDFVLLLAVVAAVVFFSEIASNTATATTLIPILAAMAPGLGLHPYLLVIPAALAASLAFMMPVGTPPNAIVFGTGYVTMPQMIKAGFWLNLTGIALIMAVTYAIIVPMMGAGPE
jgi:sodium-dependent dicarboxylate transporter 2/3/5